VSTSSKCWVKRCHLNWRGLRAVVAVGLWWRRWIAWWGRWARLLRPSSYAGLVCGIAAWSARLLCPSSYAGLVCGIAAWSAVYISTIRRLCLDRDWFLLVWGIYSLRSERIVSLLQLLSVFICSEECNSTIPVFHLLLSILTAPLSFVDQSKIGANLLRLLLATW